MSKMDEWEQRRRDMGLVEGYARKPSPSFEASPIQQVSMSKLEEWEQRRQELNSSSVHVNSVRVVRPAPAHPRTLPHPASADAQGRSARNTLPSRGTASTYADKFDTRPVKHPGQGITTYTHQGFSAALLGSHRGDIPFGTKVRVSYRGRSCVVLVNDTGGGSPSQDRVLDLSHAAMAYLLGVETKSINDKTAGLMSLDSIAVVDPAIPVGPD